MDLVRFKRCLQSLKNLCTHVYSALRDPRADIKKAASLALQRSHSGVSNESKAGSIEGDPGLCEGTEKCEKLKEIHDFEKSFPWLRSKMPFMSTLKSELSYSQLSMISSSTTHTQIKMKV